MNILTVSLPIRLRARLVGKIKTAEVTPTSSPEEALEALKQGSYNLLVFHEVKDEDPLEGLRLLMPRHKGRVVFCSLGQHPSDFLQHLVKSLRVSAILQSPVDPDELIRRVSIELDTRVPSLSEKITPARAIPAALLPVWQRHQETNLERVGLLAAGADPEAEEEIVEAARRAAHQLAGSLGTFGLSTASLLARDAETQLGHFPLNDAQRERMETLIHAIELQLADPQLQLPDLESAAPLGSLLLFSNDAIWVDEFKHVAHPAGYRVLSTDDPTGARRLYALEDPAAVVLDLAEGAQEAVALVHDLSGRGQPLLALLDPGVVARLGCKTLTKPVAPALLLDALQAPAQVDQMAQRRVLAVDDDPLVLETVATLLTSLNVEMHTLEEPLTFWETLQKVKPDLVILDVDLPYVSGIELCRAMRAEPKLAHIPVIFMSAYNDSDTVHRVFLAGGDDYVFKPVVGPELITRVRNRLMRQSGAVEMAAHAVAASGEGTDLAFLVSDEELSRQIFAHFVGLGYKVERLTATGSALVEKLTCRVEARPRVVLLDVLPTNDILYGLEGLGVNDYSQVWVRGDLTEAEIGIVYESGLAGYLPEGLDPAILLRKLERTLRSNSSVMEAKQAPREEAVR